jgi:hypothetical protein
MDYYQKEPTNVVTWRVFDAAYNFVLGLFGFCTLFTNAWPLGLFPLGLVAYWELSPYLKAKRKDKILPLAEQGNVEAQFELGNIYAAGEAVTKDYVEALRWYKKAAEQGYPKAQDRVSAWYAGGHGTSMDNVEAYFWLSLAKKSGTIKTFLDSQRMEQYLTTDQIAAVNKRVSEWKPSTT